MAEPAAHPPSEYRTGSDPRTLRDALGCFATGVTIVTCLDESGSPVGLTANSFTSVSLDPFLVLFCPERISRFHDAVLASGSFAVSVLAEGQQEVSRRFAVRGRPLDGQFDDVETPALRMLLDDEDAPDLPSDA